MDRGRYPGHTPVGSRPSVPDRSWWRPRSIV